MESQAIVTRWQTVVQQYSLQTIFYQIHALHLESASFHH
jgi:hypothetical protein